MAQLWMIVGGVDKGGVVVREGADLQSPMKSSRLSTGAVVEQLELRGERLRYQLQSGTGLAREHQVWSI